MPPRPTPSGYKAQQQDNEPSWGCALDSVSIVQYWMPFAGTERMESRGHGLLGDDCPRGTRHGRRLESQSIQYEYILDRFFMWHSCGGYCTSKVPSGKLPPTLTSLYEYCTSTVQLQYSMKVLGSCTLRVTPHMLLTCSDRSERRSQREEIVRSG
jgi:hypothetical protein